MIIFVIILSCQDDHCKNPFDVFTILLCHADHFNNFNLPRWSLSQSPSCQSHHCNNPIMQRWSVESTLWNDDYSNNPYVMEIIVIIYSHQDDHSNNTLMPWWSLLQSPRITMFLVTISRATMIIVSIHSCLEDNCENPLVPQKWPF